MKFIASLLAAALTLTTLAVSAQASTPTAPLQAVQTDQAFQIALFVDPGAVRELGVSIRVMQGGVLRRTINLPAIAVAGRASVPLALDPRSLADLPAGHYAAVVGVTGVPVVAGLPAFRDFLPVHFQVSNGQALARSLAAYSAAVDATRLEGAFTVHGGATQAAAAPRQGANSADRLVNSANLGPNGDRSEVGRN